MVFVKVRETYDLHTTKDRMTVIALHTPKPDILKRNYPGLLMQCKAYRPYSCSARLACASVMPLDPLGVGTAEGSVAPEDVFNPILYKAMSNFGMSQLEARIAALGTVGASGSDIDGSSATVDVDSLAPSTLTDDFGIYYGLLANTHEWRHANPQQGLEMNDLKPYVYEMLYNIGDNYTFNASSATESKFSAPHPTTGNATLYNVNSIRGNSKPMPFINCTAYSYDSEDPSTLAAPGFPTTVTGVSNASVQVPYLNVVVGTIIVPPSRMHELFFRLVVEWTIEFSQIRPLSDIATPGGVASIGFAQHFINYSYSATKEALTGSRETILEKDACMVSSNVNVDKVM